MQVVVVDLDSNFNFERQIRQIAYDQAQEVLYSAANVPLLLRQFTISGVDSTESNKCFDFIVMFMKCQTKTTIIVRNKVNEVLQLGWKKIISKGLNSFDIGLFYNLMLFRYIYIHITTIIQLQVL